MIELETKVVAKKNYMTMSGKVYFQKYERLRTHCEWSVYFDLELERFVGEYDHYNELPMKCVCIHPIILEIILHLSNVFRLYFFCAIRFVSNFQQN